MSLRHVFLDPKTDLEKKNKTARMIPRVQHLMKNPMASAHNENDEKRKWRLFENDEKKRRFFENHEKKMSFFRE